MGEGDAAALAGGTGESGLRRLDLPARLDVTAADELAEALEHLREVPLEINAAGVEQAGTLCLQVLLAARQQWLADGLPFRIAAPSGPLRDAVSLLGLTPHFFDGMEPQ